MRWHFRKFNKIRQREASQFIVSVSALFSLTAVEEYYKKNPEKFI